MRGVGGAGEVDRGGRGVGDRDEADAWVAVALRRARRAQAERTAGGDEVQPLVHVAHLDRPGRALPRGPQVRRGGAGVRPQGQREVLVGGELGQQHPVPARERVVVGQGRDPVLRVEGLGADARVCGNRAKHRHVGVPGGEARGAVVLPNHLERGVWVRTTPGPEQRNGLLPEHRAGVAETQRAGNRPGVREGRVQVGEDRPPVAEQGRPGSSEGKVSGGTIDEPDTDARFQLDERTGERGLRHVQPGRRGGDSARLGHRVQSSEVAQFHIIHAYGA
ncbi:hypothetical protein EES42_09345 [Streptomyces sp. ADI95-17]|nr:hypothetical protein EES42_09345 [Streptomyces sp. ADI95-17]